MSEYDSESFYSGRGKANYAAFYNVEIRRPDDTTFFRPYVLIVSPGQSRSEVRRPANEQDQKEYPAAWAAFLEKKDAPLNGTPIDMLPGMTDDRAKQLKTLHVYTIEQMAQVSDGNLNNIGMGATALRETARAWVKGHGPEMDQMQRTLKQMAERMEKLEKENAALKAGKGDGGGKKAA